MDQRQRSGFHRKDINQPNCPQLRSIEKNWPIVIQTLKKSGKVTRNATEMMSWDKMATQIGSKYDEECSTFHQ